MSGGDPSRAFLRAVAHELRWHPLSRRRLLTELAQHLDDSVADLRASGLPPDAAVARALSRLGKAEAVAAALRSARTGSRWAPRIRRLRSPAWLAVGAMSLVTMWAAELPQASGAEPTHRPGAPAMTRVTGSGHGGPGARPRPALRRHRPASHLP